LHKSGIIVGVIGSAFTLPAESSISALAAAPDAWITDDLISFGDYYL